MERKEEESPMKSGQDKLKWDMARELGLDDDLAAGGDELTVKEAGKIGGNMVKKLVEEGKEKLEEENTGTTIKEP